MPLPDGEEVIVDERAYAGLRWLERGEGEPVLLLHGLMGTMHHWDEVLDGLTTSCRALAPALPIFDPAFEYTSVQALAAHVRRFMDALGLERAVVGGNSLGGHVAVRLALASPERVSGLVLTGSSGLFERSFTRGMPHRAGAAFVREKMEEIFYDRALVTPEWVDSVCRTLAEPATALRALRFARAARRDNVEGRLGEITAPTLVVWGADDRITPPAVAERFLSRISDSQLVFLRRCGHAPMLEQPQAFAAILRAWLEDTRARSGAAPAKGNR
ncbi:MAG: alpha/beta fold hydrolase [Candidatus Rokuibacteriota bacterium]